MKVLLENRKIWITGGSHGIGLELAKRLLEKNNSLIITARSQSSLRKLESDYPGRVTVLCADLSFEQSAQHLRVALEQHCQHLDTIILNAGICEYVDVRNPDMALVDRVTQTNYLGFVRSLYAALPLLRQSSNSPHIVGISSASAYIGLPRAQAYGASKAAMRHFLQSLRVDLYSERIDVSIVYPGFVDTRLTRANDFEMPFQLTTGQAVERMIIGMEKRKNEIAFPRRLIWPLRLMSVLPAGVYTLLAQKMVRQETNEHANMTAGDSK